MEKTSRKDLPSIRDERGEIIDLLTGVSVDAITVVTLNQGAVRGNHIHKETTQWNYVMSGSVKYVTRKGDSGPVEEVVLNAHDICVSRPGEAHTFVGVANYSEMFVFTRGPRGGKEYETDTYRLDVPLVTKKN